VYEVVDVNDCTDGRRGGRGFGGWDIGRLATVIVGCPRGFGGVERLRVVVLERESRAEAKEESEELPSRTGAVFSVVCLLASCLGEDRLVRRGGGNWGGSFTESVGMMRPVTSRVADLGDTDLLTGLGLALLRSVVFGAVATFPSAYLAVSFRLRDDSCSETDGRMGFGLRTTRGRLSLLADGGGLMAFPSTFVDLAFDSKSCTSALVAGIEDSSLCSCPTPGDPRAHCGALPVVLTPLSCTGVGVDLAAASLAAI
jgi:hypothetical protein